MQYYHKKIVIQTKQVQFSALIERFIRFGHDWFERFLPIFNVEVIVVNSESLSLQKELVQDIVSILYVFGFRIYGLRKCKEKS